MFISVCITYLPVAVIKKKKKQMTRSNPWKTVYFGLQLQRNKTPSWLGGIAASNTHEDRSRKLRDHIFRPKQELAGNGTRLLTLKRPLAVTFFLQQAMLLNLPDSTTSWGPSVQISEPMGDIFILTA